MIEINGIKKRDEKRQIAFFTLNGQEFACGNVPIEISANKDILAYLEKREDEFKLLILRKSYPEANINSIPQKEDATEIEKWNLWIAKGHKNRTQVGLTKTGRPKYGYEVVEKQELLYRHPKWIGLTAKIEASSIDKETKDLLKEIIK